MCGVCVRGESGNAQRMGRVFGKWPHSCLMCLPLLFSFNFLRLEPKMASKQGQHHLTKRLERKFSKNGIWYKCNISTDFLYVVFVIFSF